MPTCGMFLPRLWPPLRRSRGHFFWPKEKPARVNRSALTFRRSERLFQFRHSLALKRTRDQPCPPEFSLLRCPCAATRFLGKPEAFPLLADSKQVTCNAEFIGSGGSQTHFAFVPVPPTARPQGRPQLTRPTCWGRRFRCHRFWVLSFPRQGKTT
jgi:hypothetical protein